MVLPEPGGAAHQEWAMLTDPRAQDLLVASGIFCCDNDISLDHLARLDFNGGHLFLPQVPFLAFDSYFKVNQGILSDGGEGYAGEFTQSISEIRICLKAHGPADTPLGSENHILLHESLNLDNSRLKSWRASLNSIIFDIAFLTSAKVDSRKRMRVNSMALGKVESSSIV